MFHRALLPILLAIGTACAPPPREGITFLTMKPDQREVWEEAFERFRAAHPDIPLHVEIAPRSSTQYHDLLSQKLKNRDPSVDVFMMDVTWPPEFASAGWARPLDDWFPPEDRADYLPGPLEANTFLGRIYGVPSRIDAGMLYYRRDLLDRYGFSAPQTWPELVEQAETILAAERVRQPSLVGYSTQFKQYEGLVCNLLEYFWGNGGNVLDEQGRVVLDSPENIAALQFVCDMISKDKITPPGIKTYKEDESLQAFRAGKAVFLRNWPYVWGLTQRPREQLLGKVGMVPMPHSDGYPRSAATLGGWNIMLSKYTRHPEEAWKFAQFITSEDSQKERFLPPMARGEEIWARAVGEPQWGPDGTVERVQGAFIDISRRTGRKARSERPSSESPRKRTSPIENSRVSIARRM